MAVHFLNTNENIMIIGDGSKINLLDNLAKKNEVIVTKATGQTPNQLKESIDKADQVTLRRMAEKESKAIEFIKQLDDLKNYINSNGISYNDQQLASKYGNIVALYKDTKELGALDNGVENLVNKVGRSVVLLY